MKIIKRILSMVLVFAFIMGSSGFNVSAAKPPKSITILTTLETMDVYSGEDNAVDFTIEAKYGDVDASGDAWSFLATPDESLGLEDYGNISLAENNPLTERKLIWNFSYVAPVLESDTIIPFDLELSDGPTSDTIRIYFNVFGSGTSELIDAQTPEITAQPTDTNVNVGVETSLTVTASVDTGALSYQWYSNNTKSNVGGSGIEDATSNTYTFTPTEVGTTYYYCVITNIDENATGVDTAIATSEVATVVATAVPEVTNAEIPTIITQPADTAVEVGETASLSVEASVTVGDLSYQWYSNDSDSNVGGSAIPGATSTPYTFIPTEVGTTYYYCVITNIDENATGVDTAIATSEFATVQVTDVQIPPDPDTINYVILGDSIATGTVTGNPISRWFGVPSEIDSYADYFAEYLEGTGATTVNVSDFSYDGDQSYQLLEKLESNTEMQQAIEAADVITISIGGNNLMYAAQVDGNYDFDVVNPTIAEQGRAQFESDWPEIVYWLDYLTDGVENNGVDAKIIVNTIYNPYYEGDVLYPFVDALLNNIDENEFDIYGRGINTVIEDAIYSEIYSVADVYDIFSAYKTSEDDMNIVTYMYYDPVFGIELRNPHPTAFGQSLIYDEVVNQYKK